MGQYYRTNIHFSSLNSCNKGGIGTSIKQRALH